MDEEQKENIKIELEDIKTKVGEFEEQLNADSPDKAILQEKSNNIATAVTIINNNLKKE